MHNSNSEGEQWESQCLSNPSQTEHSILSCSNVEYEQIITDAMHKTTQYTQTETTSNSIAIQADTISAIFKKLNKECGKLKAVSEQSICKLENEKSALLYKNQFLEEKNAALTEELKMHSLQKSQSEIEITKLTTKLENEVESNKRLLNELHNTECLHRQSEQMRLTEMECLKNQLMSYKQLYESITHKYNADKYERAKSTEKRVMSDRNVITKKESDDRVKTKRKENNQLLRVGAVNEERNTISRSVLSPTHTKLDKRSRFSPINIML